MNKVIVKIRKWLPALFVMGLIFWFSNHPSNELPNFDWADKLIKKTGHVVVYAMLAGSYLYALDMRVDKSWLAWLLAILFAATDEYHQAFVPGRHPSVWDVLIFDNFGALISLWLANKYIMQKPPDEDI